MIRPCRLILALLPAILVAGVAMPVHAAVPQTIAFQGYLADNGGQPLAGTVNLDIAVYAAASGGAALWSETHGAVPVSQGVFAVALGSVTPLGGAVTNGAPRFLGVRVNGEAELPRTELRSAPFALRAQAADTVRTAIGIVQGPVLALATKVNGQGETNLEWRCSDFNQMVAKLGAGNSGDGSLVMLSANGGTAAEIYSSLLGNPFLGLYGTGQSAFLDLEQIGDTSVRFPIDGINALETVAEPGLVSVTNTNFTTLSSAVSSVLSRTLTPPQSGYVLALGQSVARVTHTSGIGTSGAIGLSDDGVGFGTAQDVNVQIASAAASGSYSIPLHVNGVFVATGGIPLTVHLMGSESSGVIEVEDVSLTLLYVPTAYGIASPTLLAAGDGEDVPARGPQTPAEISAEQAAARQSDVERLERELAAMRTEHAARLAEFESRLQATEAGRVD
jgi:hypothetical protein